MESPRDDAAAQLAAAERMREAFATELRLPAGFHVILGAATAVLSASVAFAAGTPDTGAAIASVVGVVLFLLAAAYLVRRFQELNGVRVGGLVVHAVLGSTLEASVAFCLPFAFATWAAIAGLPWLAILLSVVAGVAYAVCARRWWAAYQRDPERGAAADSRLVLALVVVAIVAGGVFLLGLMSGR